MTEAEQAPPDVDVSTPSPARLYDYFLGGTANYEADRLAGDRLHKSFPDLFDCAWGNRGFHQRAAQWMAGQGVSQFIDIGCGLPTQGNTHDAVRRVTPGARVAYVDNDPLVRAMSRELLADDGLTTVIIGDLRDPDTILGSPDLRMLIDFTRPVGLLMTGVLHFVADGSDPWGLVARYTAELAPGSYLALSHATADKMPPHTVQALEETFEHATEQMHLRPLAEVERFFAGMSMVPPYLGAAPAVSYVGVWGADDPEVADTDGSRLLYCGVARCR